MNTAPRTPPAWLTWLKAPGDTCALVAVHQPTCRRLRDGGLCDCVPAFKLEHDDAVVSDRKSLITTDYRGGQQSSTRKTNHRTVSLLHTPPYLRQKTVKGRNRLHDHLVVIEETDRKGLSNPDAPVASDDMRRPPRWLNDAAVEHFELIADRSETGSAPRGGPQFLDGFAAFLRGWPPLQAVRIPGSTST